MKRTLHPDLLHEIAVRLEQAHNSFQKRYPGSTGARQPVHTVYGGAHLFRADTAKRLGETALRSLDEFAPDREDSRWPQEIGTSIIPCGESLRSTREVHRLAEKLHRDCPSRKAQDSRE